MTKSNDFEKAKSPFSFFLCLPCLRNAFSEVHYISEEEKQKLQIIGTKIKIRRWEEEMMEKNDSYNMKLERQRIEDLITAKYKIQENTNIVANYIEKKERILKEEITTNPVLFAKTLNESIPVIIEKKSSNIVRLETTKNDSKYDSKEILTTKNSLASKLENESKIVKKTSNDELQPAKVHKSLSIPNTYLKEEILKKTVQRKYKQKSEFTLPHTPFKQKSDPISVLYQSNSPICPENSTDALDIQNNCKNIKRGAKEASLKCKIVIKRHIEKQQI